MTPPSELTQFDPCSSSDALLDFTMQPYRSPVPRSESPLSSASLLALSSDLLDPTGATRSVLAVLRWNLGHSRTIFAIVQEQTGVSWEFYWYNVAGLVAIGLDDVVSAFGGLVSTNGPWANQVPDKPEVFSLDLGLGEIRGERPLEHVNLYTGNLTSPVPSGLNYRLDNSGLQLRNLYHRFSGVDLAGVRQQLSSSLHIADPEHAIWSELLPCESIHVANKARRDGLYWGGVSVDQLIWFLARTNQSLEFTNHVVANKHHLAHLRFDLGVDFRHGTLSPVKTAIYGVL